MGSRVYILRESSLFKSIRTVGRFKLSTQMGYDHVHKYMPNAESWESVGKKRVVLRSICLIHLCAIEMIRDPLWLEKRNALCTLSSLSSGLYLLPSFTPLVLAYGFTAWHLLSTSFPGSRCFLTPCGQRRVARAEVTNKLETQSDGVRASGKPPSRPKPIMARPMEQQFV